VLAEEFAGEFDEAGGDSEVFGGKMEGGVVACREGFDGGVEGGLGLFEQIHLV